MMDIYIVLYEKKRYYSEGYYQTHKKEDDALLQAIECASSSTYEFRKVLKLNTSSYEVTEYELGIVKGQIKLKEKPTDGNQ